MRHALRVLLNEEWISGEIPNNVDSRTEALLTADEDVDPWTDAWLTEHAERLRTRAEQALHARLDHFAWHLDGRDVCQYRFDNGQNAGVDAYVTGGPTMGDDPTEAYGAWDIVCDEDDRFPPGWPQQIGAAAGLIHPQGGGRPMATVTFHAWA